MLPTPSILRATKLATLALGATAAVACSDSTTSTGPQGIVQFINAAPQRAKADLNIDAGNSVNNLPYAQGTQFYVHASDTSHIFTAYDSTGTTSLAEKNVTVADGQAYTLVLVQDATVGTNYDLLYFPDTVSAPASGTAKIRVVNTSPSVTSLDVYVLAVGSTVTDLNAATPLSTSHVPYNTVFAYTQIASGAHRLVFTTAGTKTIVSDVPSLTFADGSAVTFLTLDKLGGGAPVSTFYWSER